MSESSRTSPYQLGTYHINSENETGKAYRYEPQRTNNFEVQITGLSDNKVVTLSTNNFSSPNIQIDIINVPYGNNTIKFAGKPTYTDATIQLNDFIGADVAK